MVTPSFGLTATERVLPKLALDFTTASLDGRITFTRTTDATYPATYVNSSGVLTAATNNQPRFDYDPVTLACKGLLIEESKANLLSYSEAFDNAVWSSTINILAFGGGSVANATTAPDGNVTADLITPSTTSGIHRIARTITVSSGVSYTASYFIKSNGYTKVAIQESAVTAARAAFDCSGDGTVLDAALGGTGQIQKLGNGWYRITMVSTSGGTSFRPDIYILNPAYTTGSISGAWAANGTSGIYIWGAQLEAGAFATSYIPTTTTSLTRNADVVTMTGTNFSDWFNAAEGTFAVGFRTVDVSAARSFYAASDGTSNNELYGYNPAGGAAYFRVAASTAQQAFINGGAIIANTNYSSVSGYKADSFATSRNGSVAATDTTGVVPTVDRLTIGSRATGITQLNGHVLYLNYYAQLCTAREIQAISSRG